MQKRVFRIWRVNCQSPRTQIWRINELRNSNRKHLHRELTWSLLHAGSEAQMIPWHTQAETNTGEPCFSCKNNCPLLCFGVSPLSFRILYFPTGNRSVTTFHKRLGTLWSLWAESMRKQIYGYHDFGKISRWNHPHRSA